MWGALLRGDGAPILMLSSTQVSNLVFPVSKTGPVTVPPYS